MFYYHGYCKPNFFTKSTCGITNRQLCTSHQSFLPPPPLSEKSTAATAYIELNLKSDLEYSG